MRPVSLINEATLNFARQHADDDVRQIALRGAKAPDVDLTLALQQIQGRQTARRKLPTWAGCDGIIYPPHLNMEQCSSEHTARYKLAIVQRLLKDNFSFGGGFQGPTCCVDLTGGFGIDYTIMASAFDEALYVEHDEGLVAIVNHNLPLLGVHHARTVCCDAAATLHGLSHATLIFLDPARRDQHGGRTYALTDCTPDVLQLRETLLEKADIVMLKLSPMLDWRKAMADLGREHVCEVHIVSVGGECKELLVIMSSQATGFTLFCSNNDEVWALNPYENYKLYENYSPQSPTLLYEPNASVMKAGCWAELSAAFHVSQIAPNSHLFLSEVPIADFPGRGFSIETSTTMNKRDLRRALQGISQANITTRNFPLTPQQLRQRLKIKDGGETFIFATTDADNQHILFVCHPLRNATKAFSSDETSRME